MSSMMTTAAASGAGFQPLLTALRDVYSAEIYFSALPNLRFDQFATRKEELSAQPGGNIVLQKMSGMKRGGRLQEGKRIETRAMSASQQNVTVDERGNAVALSERLVQQSFYDQLAAASMLLGRDMALVLDIELRDTATGSPNKVYANGRANRAALVVGDVFTPKEVYTTTEALETNNAPKLFADFYLAMLHPHQLNGMRQAAGWVNAQYYVGSGPIFNGEVGRWNDVRFISTSMIKNGFSSAVDSTGDYVDPAFDPNLANGTGGNQTTIYQAVIFGEYSYGHAVGLPVEMRDNGVQDFGREHALAWYAIWGHSLLETNHIVTVETA